MRLTSDLQAGLYALAPGDFGFESQTRDDVDHNDPGGQGQLTVGADPETARGGVEDDAGHLDTRRDDNRAGVRRDAGLEATVDRLGQGHDTQTRGERFWSSWITTSAATPPDSICRVIRSKC